MRCEGPHGEVAQYRIAASDGELLCCTGERCPYKAGDYILTVENPFKPGETCEVSMNPTMFALSCKVIP
jgi:hypothetical protein